MGMGFYDNHNHSQFSFDGHRTTVEASVEAAKAAGLDGICFTDHCDFFVPPMKAEHENLVPEVFDVTAQQAEIDRVKAGVTGIEIFKGIEIGLYNSCRDKIRQQLSEHSFDEVIASVHYLDNTDPFYGGYYSGGDWKRDYGHYIETLYEEMVWLGDFDIMGHFDYVVRYCSYPQASILYKDFPDLIDAMLKYLAEEGKALEINTKTYQVYNGRLVTLDKNILLRFRELGGEMISLGSDSHDPSRPGADFDKAAALARACGFKYLTHFAARKPILLKI